MQQLVSRLCQPSLQSQMRLRLTSGVASASLGSASREASPPAAPPASARPGGAWQVSVGACKPGGEAALTGMSLPTLPCPDFMHPPLSATTQDIMKSVGGLLGLLISLVVLESKLEDNLGKRFADMKCDVNAKFDDVNAKFDKLEAKMEAKFDRADDRYTALLLTLLKGAEGEGPEGDGPRS